MPLGTEVGLGPGDIVLDEDGSPQTSAQKQLKWRPFGHNKRGPNLGAVPLLGGGAGSPCDTVAWAEAYLHTKWHLNPSSHLATMKMG